MKARWLLLLPPLAAVLTGKPLHAPKLRSRLFAADKSESCRNVLTFYLQAYAYRRPDPHAALRLLSAAERQRSECPGDTQELSARIEALREELLAIDRFPTPNPSLH